MAIAGDSDGFAGKMDEVVQDIATNEFQLSTYLSRPVKIADRTCTLGEGFVRTVYEPWHLFFNSPPIKNKIENFAFIQCDLKIKVVVTSTPFVYAKYLLSYRPHTNFASQHDITAYTSESMNYVYSQRPNIEIDVHDCKGGEMTLPFFWYKNWLDLTIEDDVKDMGELTLVPMTTPKSANGLTTRAPVITIYAWAENVRMAGNTVSLSLQSGESMTSRVQRATGDEYGTGPVSNVASAVANYSGGLSNVPVIGPFAKATSMVAGAIGRLASLFGFTNVPVIDNVRPVKDQPFHAFASSEIGVPVEKLTIDPKCELSIDPGVSGLPPQDELSLAHICTRQSYIHKCWWTQSHVIDASLYRINVTPTVCHRDGTTEEYFVDTPMGFASRMFSHWRGSIVFTFKVVCSKYHQGRLRITFDPVGDIFSDAVTTSTCITKIVDVAETNEVEIIVPYTQPQSWSLIRPDVVKDVMALSTADDPYDSDFHNGRLEVRVLNPLSGPDNTASVGILMYMKAGDDFELANPSDFVADTSVFKMQSKESSTSFMMGPSPSPPSNRYLVNFGERVVSLRTIMRRTCKHRQIGGYEATTLTTPSLYKYVSNYCLYPFHRGYDPNGRDIRAGINNPGTNYKYNFCSETPYTWITLAFIGQRGSMIYSFDSLASEPNTEYRAVRQNAPLTYFEAITEIPVEDIHKESLLPYGLTGQCLQNERTQTGLQFLVPFMNKYRFVSTSPEDRCAGNADDDTDYNNFLVTSARIYNDPPTNIEYGMVEYHCIGTDYTPVFFLSVPVRWLYIEPEESEGE